MKKLLATTAIILGLTIGSYAQGGLFHRGASAGDGERADYSLTRNGGDPGDPIPMLPNHNAQGDNQPAPVGSGFVILAGLGAAYLVGKKRSEE